MNKYQEAMKIYDEACNSEGYDYRGTMGRDLGLDEIKPLIQELVDNFGDFEAVLDSLIKLTEENRSHAYGRDIDYYHGVLDTLLKFKETLYKKEGE